jgi:hypothetical protein
MAPLEYRSRYGRIVMESSGIKVMESRAEPLFVAWHAVGYLECAELDRGSRRVRLIRMHLADGRTVPLPAPTGADDGFDLAAAEIFRAWRGYTRTRIREPQDEIPPEFRASAARQLDPIRDSPPPPIEDARPPHAGDGSLPSRRWLRWRIGR